MELAKQIKKYRIMHHLSQDELANKLYVSRQTISNWETQKSYPDIHSLLLMSSLFDISLDELIKGDLLAMEEEIKKEDIQLFKKMSLIYSILFILGLINFPILYYFFSIPGLVIALLFYIFVICYATKI